MGTNAAVDFLEKFHVGGPWNLTAIWPSKDKYPPAGRHRIEGKTFLFGQQKEMSEWIEERNKKYNLYFSVAALINPLAPHGPGAKAAKTNLLSSQWCHVDVDPILPESGATPELLASERDRILRDLQSYDPPPTVITDSGGGYQGFWKRERPFPINGAETSAEPLEDANKELGKPLGADKCFNADRIMRIPFTRNLVTDVKRDCGRSDTDAVLVSADWERSYGHGIFDAMPSAAGAASQPNGGSTVGHHARLDTVDDLDQWGVSARLKAVIVQGSDTDSPKPGDNSRSAWVFDTFCNLVRTGVPDDVIAAIFRDPDFKISEYIREKADPEESIRYHIARAKEAVSDDAPRKPPNGASGKPNGIVMVPGELGRVIDQAEEALLEAGYPIYQRGGELVRLGTVSLASAEKASEKIKRKTGTRVIVPVDEWWLLQKMDVAAPWYRLDSDGRAIKADPKINYARHLLARSGEWNFPTLRALLPAPTLALDGRIIEQPGYDAGSHLYLDFAPGAFPAIPANPSLEDAKAALAKINNLFRGFPFQGDVSRAVALSSVLTSLVRSNMRTAPLHGFDAPTAGTGKSLLVEIAGIIASGDLPPAMSQGKGEEEDEKRLSISLRAGDPIIWIDNCERPLSGDFLCSMLTQEKVMARILGKSERVIMPTTSLPMATGNNLQIAGDVVRRSVVCRVDAGEEKPETRPFNFDPRDEARSQRAELVVAGLTALRAFRLSSFNPGLTAMGSFADYEWIRGTLKWCGYADPAGDQGKIHVANADTTELLDIMDIWEKVYGLGIAATVAEIQSGREIKSDTPPDKLPPGEILYRRLLDATGKAVWSGKSVGNYLARKKDSVVGNRRFTAKDRGGRLEWTLESVATKPQPK